MGARSLRRLDQPRPLRVITGPSGIPHAIIVDEERREVTAIREDWLVQDRWWTDAPVDRHYYELVVEPGKVVVTFHDTRGGGWYAHMEPSRGQIGKSPRRQAL